MLYLKYKNSTLEFLKLFRKAAKIRHGFVIFHWYKVWEISFKKSAPLLYLYFFLRLNEVFRRKIDDIFRILRKVFIVSATMVPISFVVNATSAGIQLLNDVSLGLHWIKASFRCGSCKNTLKAYNAFRIFLQNIVLWEEKNYKIA